jgi:hypothetical protein
VFLLAATVQYGLYHYLLREPLQSHDLEKARSAFMRWIKIDVVWQGLVILGSGVYMVAVGSGHPSGFAWVSPAVGATFGTALPLQLVVVAALRSAR